MEDGNPGRTSKSRKTPSNDQNVMRHARMLCGCLLLATFAPRVSAIKVLSPPCDFLRPSSDSLRRLAPRKSLLATGVLCRGTSPLRSVFFLPNGHRRPQTLSWRNLVRAPDTLRVFLWVSTQSGVPRLSRGREGNICKDCVLRPGNGLPGRVGLVVQTRPICPVPRSHPAIVHLQYPLLCREGTQHSAPACPA